MKPSHTTEVKPGVTVDMSDYGRQPDTAPTDMSHQKRNLAKAAASVRGNLKLGGNSDAQ
ncbi:hypothetical protein [Phyllobacterium brassicacearum]|uniref:hypothetical protein n=1 Tax=Phyllobacterium brassicacearum TaxID=314235 RepID=UPI0010E65EB2|nr:hypothetical protein [Phyllobacterium brassicacearum]TDQ19887.1 hypothetical protein DEV91_12482 [Phyllobacterium brassicacearum]